VVFNITGGRDLTLHEVNIAAEAIYEVVDPNANIIFGAVIDEKMQGEIRITVIATGFSGDPIPEKKAEKTEKTVKTPIVSNEPSVFPVEEKEEESPNPPTLDIPAFLQKRRFPKP
jgi:cell division protein FtsZ